MSFDVGSIDLERETSQAETKTLKKSNKITLCNQKLIHEKYDNLKVDSDTIKTVISWLAQQTLVFYLNNVQVVTDQCQEKLSRSH